MDRIAIIGFGCAGFNAVGAIREAGSRDDIHVYSDGVLPPANPMLTTYYAAGKISFETMFPFGTLSDISGKYKLTIHTKAKVESINEAEKTVTLEDNKIESFDKLLIATGASPFMPPLQENGTSRIYYMRTVEDAGRLKSALETGNIRSAVVIGGSMVGIKVVELLYNKGIACTLADMATQLFPLAAFPDFAKIIEDRLTDKGIILRLGYGMSDARTSGSVITIKFSDGVEIESDILIICIGTRANTDITQGTSIKVNRGIVVDEHMETSVKEIYAAGDCCEGNNLQSGKTEIIGLWANAAYQGETAGWNMAGKAAKYSGNILHNITHFMDMDFISLGDNRISGEIKTYGSPKSGKYIKAVVDRNRITCINILDDSRISGIIKNYMLSSLNETCDPASPVMKGMLLRQGLPEEFISLFGGMLND